MRGIYLISRSREAEAIPYLEEADRQHPDQAARLVPMENLAICTQCWFASTASGNLLTVDDERRKLELVVQTAQKMWS